MNWFNILKNAGLAQRQRQGISARQKDEDFVFEDDDESDCYDEFVKIVEKTKNSFPNAKYVKHDQKSFKGIKEDKFVYYYDKFRMYFVSIIPKKGKIPDKVFCEAIKTYKETTNVNSNDTIENYHISTTKHNDIHYIDIFSDTEEVAASITIDADASIPISQNIDGWRGSFI